MNENKLDEIAEILFKEAETKAEREIIKARKEQILLSYQGEDKIIPVQERYEWLKTQPVLQVWESGFKRLDRRFWRRATCCYNRFDKVW